MPSINQSIGGASLVANTTGTANAITTVTVSAPSKAPNAVCVFGFMISATAAPATAVEAVLKDGATTVMTIEIPASAFAPIYFPFPAGHPYRCADATACTLTIPALGGTTLSSGQIIYRVLAF